MEENVTFVCPKCNNREFIGVYIGPKDKMCKKCQVPMNHEGQKKVTITDFVMKLFLDALLSAAIQRVHDRFARELAQAHRIEDPVVRDTKRFDKLGQAITFLKSFEGKITTEGVLSLPLNQIEQALLKALPSNEPYIQRELKNLLLAIVHVGYRSMKG